MSRNGKGSRVRGGAEERKRYRDGWERIFGKKRRNTRPSR